MLAALAAARANTDALFEIVRDSAWYERPIPARHRLIFYLGHLEAFDWNLLREPLGLGSFHESFDRLFAFGIDPPPGALPQDSASEWPSIEEVRAYKRRLRAALDHACGRAPEVLLHVAIEHRLMHAETFGYLLHNLPYDGKTPPPTPRLCGSPTPLSVMVRIPEGRATLGALDGFGWDNEFRAHVVSVPEFFLSKHKITNGEFLRFVQQGAPPPHYWRQRAGEWFYHGMFEEIPLPLSWPVYVTHRQAEAYAAWAGGSLPSEAQFHRAAYGQPDGAERHYPWGGAPPSPERGNFDFTAWEPSPVGCHPAGESAFGAAQLVGNGWEWTSTPFQPFPGFEPLPFYPNYSAPFFDGEHYVLKGGSPRTAARLLRRSFRNWFRRDYPYAYATFRVAK